MYNEITKNAWGPASSKNEQSYLMKGSFFLPDNIQPYVLGFAEENESVERGATQGQAEVQRPEVSHTHGTLHL